jgi:hypothetical protein
MAVRHGYFPIEEYPLRKPDPNSCETCFEEILRVHTKDGQVWDCRPREQAIGFWSVTEEVAGQFIEWTLYHLPNQVYVLQFDSKHDEELLKEETERLPSGAEIERFWVRADQLSPREAAAWLVKYDLELPAELKEFEKSIIATVPPTAPIAPAASAFSPVVVDLEPDVTAWFNAGCPAESAPAQVDASRARLLLKLPRQWSFAVGHVAGQGFVDADLREQIATLTKLGSALLLPARTLADAATMPLSAKHAFVMFRPALDKLADYLSDHFSTYPDGIKGPVQPPGNYPMNAQTGIMRLAETVRAMQEWDLQQPPGNLLRPLPLELVSSLERVLSDLGKAGEAGGVCLPKKPPETETPVAKSTEPATADAASRSEEPNRHSPDFRSVLWYGRDYQFTKSQAACVKVLWEEWKNKTPEMDQQTVLELADSSSNRLIDVFRDHPAWGTMIVSGKTKGSYRLQAPPKPRKKAVPE